MESGQKAVRLSRDIPVEIRMLKHIDPDKCESRRAAGVPHGALVDCPGRLPGQGAGNESRGFTSLISRAGDRGGTLPRPR